MKFIKQIGDGELTIKDNQLLEQTPTQKADAWSEQFTAQSQVIKGNLNIAS
jgi:hypothetical protein